MMSTWYMDGAEDNRGVYTKQGPEGLLQSERRRIKLQSDLVTLQRDQRLSRAVRLQSRWQELSERERQAQQQNRQLLQEFDRAQDTLRDMVTRNAAMNTIKVEYERYLEESFPRWQQQLKQKTLSAQRKRLEQHLKECLRSMEEDNAEERGSRPPIGAQPPLSPCNTNTPLYSSPYLPPTYLTVISLSLGHVQQLQNAAAHQEYHNQNGHQDYIQNGHHHPSIPSIQSSWLIHARSQWVDSQTRMHSKLQQRDMTHQPAHPLHPYDPQFLYPPQPYPVQHPQSLYPPQPYPIQPPQSYSNPSKHHIVIQQEAPPAGFPMQWAAGVATAGLHFRAPVGLQTSWTSPAMPDTQGWRIVQDVAGEDLGRVASAATSPEGGSSVGHRQKREKSSDLAHELDIKPVRLSSGHGESSESSKTSSQASKDSVSSRERRKRKEKNGGRAGQSATDRSSAGSGEVVIPEASVSSASVVQSSENDGTSVVGRNRSRMSRGLANLFSAEESGSHRDESGSDREWSVSQKEESSQIQESGSHRVEAVSQMEESRSHMQASMIKKESVSHREEVASEKEVGDNAMEATEGEEESLVGLSAEEGATGEEESLVGLSEEGGATGEEESLVGLRVEGGATGEEEEEIKHDREEGRETKEEEGMGEHEGEKEQGEDQDEGNEAHQRDREEGEEEEEEEEVQPESDSVSIREHTAEDEEDRERGEEEAEEAQDSEGQVEREEVERGDRGMEEESENEREESHTSQNGEIEEEDVGVGDERYDNEEGSEGEEDGGEEEEEEQRCQDAEEDSAAGQPEDEEERDSDDSIISPPEHRSSKCLAEVAEEEEEEVIGDNDENDDGEDDEDDKVKGYSWSVDPFPDEDDDIESLLAPQAKSQEKQEKEEKKKTVVLVKPKAIYEDLDSFSEVKALHKKKGANQDTDSEEFDHFYD
nr:glutamic acid-rich protein-like isoform X1 [Oncorhynchus nerka]